MYYFCIIVNRDLNYDISNELGEGASSRVFKLVISLDKICHAIILHRIVGNFGGEKFWQKPPKIEFGG